MCASSEDGDVRVFLDTHVTRGFGGLVVALTGLGLGQGGGVEAGTDIPTHRAPDLAARPPQSALRMSSTRSLASPKSIWVFSRKKSGFCTPA